jgi:hypothetical protein
LPYVSAILEETLRWHPAVPLGTLHFPIFVAAPRLRRQLFFRSHST